MLKIFKKKWFRLSLLCLFIVFIVYLFYLNHVIVSRFESRRWNLPSRVYSDAFPLYNGQNLTMDEMKSRLQYLNYRPVSSSPKHHGEYNQSGSRFEIYLHSFEYPHENFEGHRISFELNDNQIYNLRDPKTENQLALAKLEPELIASIFDEKMEDRTFVPLKMIPRTLTQSVILIEDERFYSHFGIDPIGIARAFFTNIIKGRLVQGGSTLTQQMVKNFFLTQERTLTRKLNEMLMSLIIELRYSKDDILEVYLNEIYFGQRGSASVTGVQEASRLYFSKDVSQLTPDESALIAAMIRAPGLYSPFRNPKNALARRNIILERLLEHEVITKKEYKDAVNRPLPQKVKSSYHTRASYFIDFLKQQLKENFTQDILQSEGLRIFTTLDMHQQRAAEKSVKNWLTSLESQRQYLKNKAKEGKFLEGALIALQPKTGFIRAYVGGRNYSKNQFDILSQAERQPGSTFKPFVYLTAIDPKVMDPPFTLATLLEDNPITIKTGPGPWKPNNYDHKFHGLVRLRTALEMSYNVATVWLSQQVGLKNVVETAKMAGMENIKALPSIVLGSLEVSPIKLAEAYTIFPNNGARSKPVAIRRVVTKDGEVLEKKSFKVKQVFYPNVIYLMNQILRGVLNEGTATSARARGFYHNAAGKTGTTSDYRDAWFAGYTPDLLALVWVGYKDNDETKLSGASGALPIWTEFMKTANAGRPSLSFKPTDDIVLVPIDKETGKLYKKSCVEMMEEYFIDGTEPTEYCNK